LVAAHHHTRQLQLELCSSITQLVDQGYELPGLLLVSRLIKRLSSRFSLDHAGGEFKPVFARTKDSAEARAAGECAGEPCLFDLVHKQLANGEVKG
jgi:hypothetical protein